jgi:hypothetical protein
MFSGSDERRLLKTLIINELPDVKDQAARFQES